jgi:drug/metabolite transporter (DMT)-like permease
MIGLLAVVAGACLFRLSRLIPDPHASTAAMLAGALVVVAGACLGVSRWVRSEASTHLFAGAGVCVMLMGSVLFSLTSLVPPGHPIDEILVWVIAACVIGIGSRAVALAVQRRQELKRRGATAASG